MVSDGRTPSGKLPPRELPGPVTRPKRSWLRSVQPLARARALVSDLAADKLKIMLEA